MTRTEPIRYGLVGAGILGSLHARVVSEHPHARLVAVHDVVLERAQELADRYPGVQVYKSAEELAAADLDAVSVATPDFAHFAPAMAVLASGRHLLLEKPMATTVEESVAIVEAARARDVTLMVDHHNRWSPPFIQARDTIAAGGIGDVRYASFRLNDTIYVPTRYISWASRSSVLWFLGPHAVDTLRWLLDDEVTEVYAVRGEGVLRAAGIETPDFYVLTLRFQKGAVATVEHSWIVSGAAPNLIDHKCQVQGARGTIFIDASHNRTLETYTSETPSGWPHVPFRDTTTMPIHRGRQAGFAAESIRHFVDCIWEGSEPLVSGLDGLRAVEVLVAAERSAASGQPVRVERRQL